MLCCFLEQPAIIISYLKICTSKNCEIFVEVIRPVYLSFASRTTLLSALVWDIYLLQFDVSAQSGTRNRICLSLFLVKLPSESVKEF
jgi:hypothetical protein